MGRDFRINVLVYTVVVLSSHIVMYTFVAHCSEDYYVAEASNWRMNDLIDEAKEHVINTIGVDITSATDREEFACRAFSNY